MAPEAVPREAFLENVVDDPQFDDAKLEEIVRVTVDGDQETLDALLLRVSTEHKAETIRWDQFLEFFCRRGKLRDSEKLIFQSTANAQSLCADQGDEEGMVDLLATEDPEEMKTRLAH